MKRWLTVAAVAAVMTALAPVAPASAATERGMSWIQSGEAAPGVTVDPFNDVSVDGGVTWTDATIIGTPAGAGVLPDTAWISSAADAGASRGAGTTLFRRAWSMRPGVVSSTGRMCVHADDAVAVRLNGTPILQQAPDAASANRDDPATCTTVTDLLRSGRNDLEFTVTNAGGGTGLDFELFLDYQIDLTAAPLLSLPEDMTRQASSRSGTVVSYLASATYPAQLPSAASCDPASGSVFPVGTTVVECSATTEGGGTTTGTFTVTVTYANRLPTLQLPPGVTVDATSPDGAVVTYDAAATDPDGLTPPTVVCSRASGETFPIGTTTVECTATDDLGGEARGSFPVTVLQSNQAPELQLPSDRTVNTRSLQGARVRWDATATDDSGAAVITCTPASGSFLRIGATTVTCTAEDGAGLTDTGSFVVTVRGPVQRACDHLAAVRPTWSTYWLQWRLRSASGEVADAGRAVDAAALRTMADRVRAAGGQFVKPALHRSAVSLADRVGDRLGC